MPTQNESQEPVSQKNLPTSFVVPEDAAEHFEAVLEAVLFAAGHPVTYEQLAGLYGMPADEVRDKITAYASQYNDPGFPRGILLLTFDKSCQLCTREQYLPYIRTALGIRRSGTLSNSTIEALAIIAYHQPVTRAYVDAVRGVDSTYAVTSLLERGLIESVGRLEAPGRPMLYGTTVDFLRCFGLSSLAELPGVTSEEAAELFARMQQNVMYPEIDENQITIDDAQITGENAPAAEATPAPAENA